MKVELKKATVRKFTKLEREFASLVCDVKKMVREKDMTFYKNVSTKKLTIVTTQLSLTSSSASFHTTASSTPLYWRISLIGMS